MENTKKLEFIDIAILVLIIMAVLFAAYLGILLLKRTSITFPKTSSVGNNFSLNTDALYVSNPVTSISSAKVTKKSGSTLTVELSLGNILGTQPKKVYLDIKTNSSTVFNSVNQQIPFRFSEPNPNNKAFSINELQKDNIIRVLLSKDLRFTAKNNILATSITKLGSSNILSGVITEISGSTIKINGSLATSDAVQNNQQDAVLLQPNEEADIIANPTAKKVHNVTLSKNTEISTVNQNGPQRLSISDLSIGTKVLVFSASPITESSFEAALVSLPPVFTTQTQNTDLTINP